MAEGVFRRRLLPHWDVPGKPVFLTACLDGSLPAAGLSRIRDYRRQLDERPQPIDVNADDWQHQKQKLVFAFVDKLLDHESRAHHLSDSRQAAIVQDAFLHFADQHYTLLAFVVMPSHHHWLFLPHEDRSREQISHSIQSYTAYECNRVRGETGAYWQRETFDHWTRDEAEMLRIITYIEQNPVQAGLVEHAQDWQWSSARIRESVGLKPGEAIVA